MRLQYGGVVMECEGNPLLMTGDANFKVEATGKITDQHGLPDAEALQAYLSHPRRFLCVSSGDQLRVEFRNCALPSDVEVTVLAEVFEVVFSAEVVVEG